MFGYVIANRDSLTPEQQTRYGACYCGLCRALKHRGGLPARMTLSYDMTFLVLLLTSLYEPTGGEAGTRRCFARPARKHSYFINRFTEYAADLNISLAWYNLMDDWADDGSVIRRAEAGLLRRQAELAQARWPRQCGAVSARLEELAGIEAKAAPSIDEAANCFGRLMGELFVYDPDDVWSGRLRLVGEALGRFVYMMDAWDDAAGDAKKGGYNPLLEFWGEDDFERRCLDILTLLIGECAEEFEKLPLVQDVEILRNVIYSGVWTRYEYKLAQDARAEARRARLPGKGKRD